MDTLSVEATVILIFASLCNGDKLLNFIPIVLELILSSQRRPFLEDFLSSGVTEVVLFFKKKSGEQWRCTHPYATLFNFSGARERIYACSA